MVSRLETPGLVSGSKTISRPVSVTAERIFLAERAGSSSRSMMPAGEDADFDIFAVGSCRSVIFAVSLTMYGSGTVKVCPNSDVEPLGQVPGELQVLALVLADRHRVGLVEQDVGGLQDRVGEQADAGPVGALLLRLVLELGHPARLAEAGDAAEHPGELGVLGHLRLDEEGAPLRVEPDGEQLRGGDPGALRAAPPGRGPAVIACRSTTQ